MNLKPPESARSETVDQLAESYAKSRVDVRFFRFKLMMKGWHIAKKLAQMCSKWVANCKISQHNVPIVS